MAALAMSPAIFPSEEFLAEVAALRGGERVVTCYACGTCSGSCPTVMAMDYGLGHILHMIQLSLEEEGVIFIRGKGAEVEAADDGRLLVHAVDTMLGKPVAVPVDMVVLSAAVVPPADADQVASLFHVSRGADGFFMEAHPKLRPVETAMDGVFLAGVTQGPKDIPDTVAQASGAASQAIGLLNRGVVEIEPMTAEVLPLRCVACGACIEVCPANAIELVEPRPGQSVAEVNAAYDDDGTLHAGRGHRGHQWR